jgi:hypothetical protein
MNSWTKPLGDRVPLWVKHRDLAIHQAQTIAHALRETDTIFERPTHATAAGDERKLRGIPAIGRGVQGVINGTRPGEGLT